MFQYLKVVCCLWAASKRPILSNVNVFKIFSNATWCHDLTDSFYSKDENGNGANEFYTE